MSYSIYEKLCKLNNVSNAEVARATGISQQTISAWKKGTYLPKTDKRRKIAEYFGVSLEYLDSGTINVTTDMTDKFNQFKELYEGNKTPNSYTVTLSRDDYEVMTKFNQLDEQGQTMVMQVIDSELERTKLQEKANERTICIAYYGKIAAAGTAIDSYDMLMNGIIEVDEDRYTRRADYAIGVSGDSMEPEYYDGDIVLCQKSSLIDYGDIGIFQYNGRIYIKQLGRDRLKSLNPGYDDIPNNGDIVCLGRVIGKAKNVSKR